MIWFTFERFIPLYWYPWVFPIIAITHLILYPFTFPGGLACIPEFASHLTIIVPKNLTFSYSLIFSSLSYQTSTAHSLSGRPSQVEIGKSSSTPVSPGLPLTFANYNQLFLLQLSLLLLNRILCFHLNPLNKII